MRLFEAILDANHRALAGDSKAGLHPAEFEQALPVVALTCIDPRLNPLMPEVLGIPEEQFIWLRNAGNIITGALSSTMRSLALACAVKGGKEIAIIGHTDCQVRKTTTMELLDKFRALGIERHILPDNINDYFGMFGSERQNVIKAAGIVRSSPLIGPAIPVHGLLVDIETGRLEWLVNGYQSHPTVAERLTQVIQSTGTGAGTSPSPLPQAQTWNQTLQSASQTLDSLRALTDFKIGEIKFPETKIGQAVSGAEDWVAAKLKEVQIVPPGATEQPPPPPAAPGPPPIPPKIAGQPPLKPRLTMRRKQ